VVGEKRIAADDDVPDGAGEGVGGLDAAEVLGGSSGERSGGKSNGLLLLRNRPVTFYDRLSRVAQCAAAI
jgi:hypothetical protein